MKLEIRIKAEHAASEQLLAGLAELISRHHIKATTIRHNGELFELNFLFESESPDNFLKYLDAIAAEIEDILPRRKTVITSYSIHYTKLYEENVMRLRFLVSIPRPWNNTYTLDRR